MFGYWLVGLWVLCATPALAETLHLINGDVLRGEVIERRDDVIVLDHALLGRIEIEPALVKPPASANPGLLGTPFLAGWKRILDVGINGKKGSSESMNVNISLNGDYEDELKAWQFRSRYYLNDTDDDDDENAKVDLTRHWLLPGSRWFFSTFGTYEWDRFESWKHRVTVAPGPGYHLIESEKHNLYAVVGPAFTREFGESDTEKAEAMLRADWTWQVSDRQRFRLSNRLFPELTDTGEFRNVSVAEYRLAIAHEPELSLSLRLENDYETDIDDDDEHNNFRYFLSLGLGF